jgi:hypothetical protein
MSQSDFILSLAGGVAAFVACILVRHLFQRLSMRRRYEAENEELVVLFQQLIRAKNDAILIDLEITERVHKLTPDQRTWWASRMRDLAASTPPIFLQQARRFGLLEPPPDEEPAEVVAPVSTHTAYNSRVQHHPAPVFVPQLNGWTGRPA